MDGQSFVADFGDWPPPERLDGNVIHRGLCGLYWRRAHTSYATDPKRVSATYRLRDDDRQKEIEEAFDRYEVVRKLKESM